MSDTFRKKTKDREELALLNNTGMMEILKRSKRFAAARITNRKLRRKYAEYTRASSPESKTDLSVAVLNEYDKSFFRVESLLRSCLAEDLRLLRERRGRTKVLDNSPANKNDYYSIAVIVKNEARYIREYILFYQATGADRIYIYDNGSTDDLLEELDGFIESGLVIYIRWPGSVAQTAAYRDAVRRARRCSKWLALVDADEFLFSPKGSMPCILKEYEEYPGIGVNWLMFGPNGHEQRPAGLVMDNYTTTLADHDSFLNCHIKSIVQPGQVLLVNHSHYAFYRKGAFAVDELKGKIDNRNAFVPAAGRAFTAHNHDSVFRINHYNTRSLEDLREKCKRGFPDGSPNAVFEKSLRPFEEPLAEDLTISKYADIVRERYGQSRKKK